MKFISWNVNGLRAVMKKGFPEIFKELDADVFCLQETKLQEGQLSMDLPGYEQYWNYADKKGYSGTAVFTRIKPLSAAYGMGIDEHDHEGRLITLEFNDYYFLTCYTPNSQNELARLDYRMRWEDDFRNYLLALNAKKPVIFCGDLNVADAERTKMTELLNAGFTDTWRYFYPHKEGVYSWWSYRFKARQNNAGWRIDYFITSKALDGRLKKAEIYTAVEGSDHCPVGLIID